MDFVTLKVKDLTVNSECYLRAHCGHELRVLWLVGGCGWRSFLKREYFFGGSVKVCFMLMFWKVDLGLPWYLWFFYEVTANLPTGELVFFERNRYTYEKYWLSIFKLCLLLTKSGWKYSSLLTPNVCVYLYLSNYLYIYIINWLNFNFQSIELN